MEKLLFIGLGRIGLPQSLVFAKKGFTVYAYDIDNKVIDLLNAKQTPFHEPNMDEYLHQTLNDTFHPFSDWQQLLIKLPDIDAIFFTLGTAAPNETTCLYDEQLDLSTIEVVLDQILQTKDALKKGINFIFRTTLPLGSIERVKNYLEKRHAMIESKDFHLAFVPERLIEGQAIQEEESLPKIIGCYSEQAYVQIKSIFDKIGGEIIRVSNPTTAEFCKLTDNSYRNMRFAFANEIAMHASQIGIDAIEVIEAINNGYQRNHVTKPGFVSGYCLSKDPYIFEYGFLKNKQQRNFHSLWYYGRRTNDYLILFTLDKLIKQLDSIDNVCVTLIGLSFKENIDDFRMSHAVILMEKMLAAGIKRFRIYDPNFNKNKYTVLPKHLIKVVEYTSLYLNKELFEGANAVLICHRHQEIVNANKRNILTQLFENRKTPLYIYDGWNVWREAEGLGGIRYEALGYMPKANVGLTEASEVNV